MNLGISLIKLIIALICTLIGIVLTVVTFFQYSKQKKKSDEFDAKPFAIKSAIILALFIIAQILLILNR